MQEFKYKTNKELEEIMRNGIENSYIPHSSYNKAKLELELRNRMVPIKVNNGIIAGGNIITGGDILTGGTKNPQTIESKKVWWKRSENVIAIIGIIIAIAIACLSIDINKKEEGKPVPAVTVTGNSNATAVGDNARATVTNIISATNTAFYLGTPLQKDEQTNEYKFDMKLVGKTPPPLLCVAFGNIDGVVKLTNAINFIPSSGSSVSSISSTVATSGPQIACMDNPSVSDWQVILKILNQKAPVKYEIYPNKVNESVPEWVNYFRNQ